MRKSALIKMFTWLSDLMNCLDFVVTFQWWNSTVSCPSFVLAMYKSYHGDGIRGNQQINDTFSNVHKKIPRFSPSVLCLRFSLTYTCSWGFFLPADKWTLIWHVGILSCNCKIYTIYRLNMTIHSKQRRKLISFIARIV